VPNAGYAWDFGDGTKAKGASVSHTFAKPGTYTVSLTATDRGGNTSTVSRQIAVLAKGDNGTTVPTTTTPGLTGHLQLVPSSLHTILKRGISVLVTSSQPADAVTSIWIPRAAARKAHIEGRAKSIAVGRGTASGLSQGTTGLRLHVSAKMAKKLSKLQHATLTVKVTLVGAGRHSFTVDAAGRY